MSPACAPRPVQSGNPGRAEDSLEPSPNHRVIVSLCKSGSTALIHSLAHAPDVRCYLQTVKSGQRLQGRPDHGVFFLPHEGIAISKETIGPNTLADCTLEVFPSDAAIRASRPVFLLRDPLDCWAAWSRSGWGTLDRFLTAGHHLFDLLDSAAGLQSIGLILRYEEFGCDVEAAFRRLTAALGIDFTPEMIEWRLRFPQESPVTWRADVQRDIERGLADSASQSTRFLYRAIRHQVPMHERETIDRELRARFDVAAGSGPA